MRRALRQVGQHTIRVVAEPSSRSPRRAASSRAAGSRPSPARIVRLLAGPPRLYWPMVPSVRTTRWHGTMSGTGLWPSAVPTARTAFGRPISAAIHPYGRTSPRGISSALVQTATSNSVRPRRSSGIRTRRSPARRRAMASARPSGRDRREERAAAGARLVAGRGGGPVVGQVHLADAAAVPGDPERADRGGERCHPVGEPGLDEDVVGEARRGSDRERRQGARRVVHGGAGGVNGTGHAVISSSPVPAAAARSMARPRWTWALSVPSGRPSTRDSSA